MPEFEVDQWEVVHECRDGGKVYLRVEPAFQFTIGDAPIGILSVSTRPYLAHKNMEATPKEKRGFAVLAGVSVSFEMQWTPSVTEFQKKTHGPWYCRAWSNGQPSAFVNTETGNAVPSGSQEFRNIMKVVRTIIASFAKGAPEWESVSAYRAAIDDRDQHQREVQRLQDKIEELNRRVREAQKAYDEAQGVASILAEKIHEWL